MRLLCLHGFAGAPSSWSAILGPFGDAESMPLVPWLAGHGSRSVVESDSFESEVERLAALVRRKWSSPGHLCGYSMGARVGLGLILEYPQLFSSATLIGVHPGLESASARSARRIRDEGIAQMIENEGIDAFVDWWQLRPLFATQQKLARAVLAQQRAVRTCHRRESLASGLRTLGLGSMPNYWDRLRDLRPTVDFLVGSADRKFAEIAKRIGALARAARVRVVEGVGHNVLLEDPETVRTVVSAGAERQRGR